MDISRMLKLILIAEIIVLFSNALAISRDYQDSWILEGLEIPFVAFVAIYALTFFFEKRMSSIVILAVIGRFVFLMIPNLKYVWFQGPYIDQHIQYALANHVLDEGHIATQGPFGAMVYGNTPLIHLTFAIFSTILDVHLVASLKYVPVLLSPIYPLLTYVVIKHSKFLEEAKIMKYALFVSSVPISLDSYIVTGSQFGVLLTFLSLSLLVVLLQKSSRRYWAIFVFCVFALAMAHSSSSVLLTIFLWAIIILQKISYFRLKSYLTIPALFTVGSISIVWLMFKAKFTWEQIAFVLFFRVPSGVTPGSGVVPLRFFELARISMIEAMKSILVYHGADVFLLVLTLAGLIILLKIRNQLSNTSKFLFNICGLMLLFIPIGLLTQAGGFRVLLLATPLFPIFSSVFILHARKRRVWVWARAIVFFLIMLLATLQLYSFQPLIPSANTLSRDLPTNEPIVYVNRVNTIYQRQMINFARDHVTGRIAADTVTRNQITGLTELAFSVEHIVGYYYPLDKSQPSTSYDFFLIHLPGISGSFTEKAEIRTRDIILETIYSSSVIYTNGESFILGWTNVTFQKTQ